MNENKTVTVAGMPVTITVAGGELVIQAGWSGPQAASGRLRVSRLPGTAAVAVYVAGEDGPDGTGERWAAGLYPAAPGAAEQLLLCDGCFQAATGQLAGCQDRCPHGGPGHDGLCLRDSPAECQWCGAPGRLHEVPRADVQRHLPTVGEEDEGMWWLHYTGGTEGPFPSAQDAWDYWHANGASEIPVPSDRQQGENRQMDDQQMLDAISKRPIARGALPAGTQVRAEVEPGSAHGGLRPSARLCAAVEWDGCVWHAAPGTGWIYWWNPPAAGREDEALAAGVITRESRDGVMQLRLADVSPARQVQDLRDELESAPAGAALAGEEAEAR